MNSKKNIIHHPSQNQNQLTTIVEKRFNLENRRFIGNKAKLIKWIVEIIVSKTYGSNSFVDIFAGSAVVAKEAMRHYKEIIINDTLYSNNIIYNGFFEKGYWDCKKLSNIIQRWNSLKPSELTMNYFSENYGDKYYNNDNSKLIGYVREEIEMMKNSLSEKEYSILISSLIYSIDKIANTVGHFDAYIKRPIGPKTLRFYLINPFTYQGKLKIYREDANKLAAKIKADIVYLDPPYNSRQYSRFYHLYENLVKWDKPKLYGIARKPLPENNSIYCKSGARDAFQELILSLRTRYIAVSYNNTYNSKSNSSRNKIELEDIKSILDKVGRTTIYIKPHKFFNAGKTNFDDHKEYLFLTEIYGK